MRRCLHKKSKKPAFGPVDNFVNVSSCSGLVMLDLEFAVHAVERACWHPSAEQRPELALGCCCLDNCYASVLGKAYATGQMCSDQYTAAEMDILCAADTHLICL